MPQKVFQKLEDLEVEDVIRANLPAIGYEGFLYMTGYGLNPFVKRRDIIFLGIRKGKEEVYYINPKQVEIIDNIIVQRNPMHAFNFLGTSLGASVERVIDRGVNQINVDTLQKLDLTVFSATMASHKMRSHLSYRDACKTLQELM